MAWVAGGLKMGGPLLGGNNVITMCAKRMFIFNLFVFTITRMTRQPWAQENFISISYLMVRDSLHSNLDIYIMCGSFTCWKNVYILYLWPGNVSTFEEYTLVCNDFRQIKNFMQFLTLTAKAYPAKCFKSPYKLWFARLYVSTRLYACNKDRSARLYIYWPCGNMFSILLSLHVRSSTSKFIGLEREIFVYSQAAASNLPLYS